MKPESSSKGIAAQTSTPADTAGSAAPRRQVRSDELFDGQREVLIEHAGEFYSLRQTSKGKLILTK
ncbi:MAG: Hemin uptake protein hemP [Betaproteobacteria bacterium]|nr:Hemin uptake protein hemP [Betaproteobacteria bacterium]